MSKYDRPYGITAPLGERIYINSSCQEKNPWDSLSYSVQDRMNEAAFDLVPGGKELLALARRIESETGMESEIDAFQIATLILDFIENKTP